LTDTKANTIVLIIDLLITLHGTPGNE